jgi:hypothetical protein
MKQLAFGLLLTISAFAVACGDDDPGGGGDLDAAVEDKGGGGGGGDALPDGGGDPPDNGIVTPDTGIPDPDGGGDNPDAMPDGGIDGGMTGPLTEEMEAGAYVQVMEGRINVGDGTGPSATVDTFATVKAKLGNGTRSAAQNTRSYEWSLANNVQLTIWFGNTNLDGDDDPPADVDANDEVLWIAVTGGYLGKTTRAVGLGTDRATVEAMAPMGYGAPENTVDLTMPPGVLGNYFTQGIYLAYDANNLVRTVTISRAYNTTPNADIQVDDARLDFALGPISGFHNLQPGTNQAQILNVLGYPDGEGDANNFHVWSYAFLGIELFFFGSQNDIFFLTIHSPYYGPLDNSNIGLGSTRVDFEAQLGMGAGVASMTNANLICYPDDNNPEVLVSYTDGFASTLTMGFITCP